MRKKKNRKIFLIFIKIDLKIQKNSKIIEYNVNKINKINIFKAIYNIITKIFNLKGHFSKF